MKTRFLVAFSIAAFCSLGAFAQAERPHLTKEERVARREEMKAKLAAQTPEERRALKEAQRAKLREKMATMTPEQREKAKERLQMRRERQAKKNG